MRPGTVRGLTGAISLVATVAAIMVLGGRWQWDALAMAAILSLPLYAVSRGAGDGHRCSNAPAVRGKRAAASAAQSRARSGRE